MIIIWVYVIFIFIFLILVVLSTLCVGIDQTIITFLLILISSGFYIKYKNVEDHNDAIIPAFFLVFMLTLIFSGMGFIFEK